MLFAIYIVYDNKRVILTKYILEKKINSDIKELNILHISDLHNNKFGKNQEKILKLIDRDYDFIFLTGDMIDRNNPNICIAMDLIENLRGNIYFIQGNHEKGSNEYDEFEKKLKNLNIAILDNEKIDFGDFEIIGIKDPSEYLTPKKKIDKDIEKELLDNLKKFQNKEKFQLLLSHRPEFFNLYQKYNYNIVFSGHAHGGQARIFGIPIIASGQGFFPKFAGGKFEKEDTIMINSRGLGNNFKWTMRVFNTPEIVEVKIKNSNI